MGNLYAGWIGILAGCLAGVVTGLFFHDPDWLGGYASWPRRMVRLGHIAFFGIGFINVIFALSVEHLGLAGRMQPASALLIIGAAAMPLVCYASAVNKVFRHLFFIPAASVMLALFLFLWRVFT
jgi:hypothetical protein